VTNLAHRIIKSPSTYPLSTLWLGGIVLLLAINQEWIHIGPAFAAFGFLTIVLIMVAFRRDIREVHTLVNSQHDDLVARVQQLTEALVSSNTQVPPERKK